MNNVEQICDQWRARLSGRQKTGRGLTRLGCRHRFEKSGKHWHLILLDEKGVAKRAVIQAPRNRFQKLTSRMKTCLQSFKGAFRTIEFVGVLAALFAFSWDFYVDKPQERAILRASFLAQIASMTEDVKTTRNINQTSAMQAIIEIIAASGQSISDLDVSGLKLKNIRLPDTIIEAGNWNQVSFINGSLRNSIIKKATFRESKFSGTDLSGIEINVRPMINFDFHLNITSPLLRRLVHRMERVDWRETDFFSVSLKDARIESTDFRGAVFHATDFEGAEIVGSWMRDTRFVSYPDEDDTDNQGSFVQVDFTGADFSDLSVETMQKMSFRDCLFERALFPEGYELPEGSRAIK